LDYVDLWGENVKKFLLMLIPILFLAGCGPDVVGDWQGSGEFSPGRNFSIHFSVNDEGMALGDFTDNQGIDKQVVICDLRYNKETGSVKFSFNPFAKTQDCSAMQNVYLFQGKMGYGVIAGELRDINDKFVGQLRALKIFE